MPVAVLAQQKISDRTAEVALELGNRADFTTGNPSRLDKWFRNAYINLCQAYNFEGLEFTLIQDISATDRLTWPVQARAIKSLIITDSNGSTTYPDFKDIQTIRRMQQSTSSKPSQYTIFGNNILFAPAFDANNYTLTIDLWQRALLDSVTLSNTPLLLPDDWLEALDYLVMMRGHTALGEPDKALAIQRLMYGYTDPSTGNHVPGMLYNLQTRLQANAPARDYGLQPRSLKVKH